MDVIGGQRSVRTSTPPFSCLLINAVQQPGTSSPLFWLKVALHIQIQ